MTTLETPPDHSKPVIGLLGAPGSGKSLVARQMASLGCGVIDADRIAKQMLNEPEVRDQLARWWGGQVIGEDGHVDRAAVARIVFEQPDELRRLEKLIHPKVAQRRAALRQRMNADPAIRGIVEDVPLLLEKNLETDCDVLVFVDVPREIRLQRVRAARGWSDQTLAAREKNQLPLDIKRNRADYVLDNGADESETLLQVRRVLSQIFQEPA